MPPNLQAQAAQAAAQGNQMLNSDKSQAASAQSQYGQDTSQAQAAQQQINNYSNYMAGAGSGTNLYNTALASQEQNVGYDPNQAAAATQALNQSLGQQADYNNFMNSAASKWGMNAGAFVAANAAGQQQNDNNINAASQQNQNWLNKYGLAQTGANQSAGLGVQGEQNTLGGYQDTYNAAASQQASALSNLQFFNQLASTQGGLNAQQQQYYGQAAQAYAAATAAKAQAGLYGQQAAQIQQQITQTAKLFADQNANGGNGGVININGTPTYDPNYSSKLGADVQ